MRTLHTIVELKHVTFNEAQLGRPTNGTLSANTSFVYFLNDDDSLHIPSAQDLIIEESFPEPTSSSEDIIENQIGIDYAVKYEDYMKEEFSEPDQIPVSSSSETGDDDGNKGQVEDKTIAIFFSVFENQKNRED